MANLVTNDEVNDFLGTTEKDYTSEIARASAEVESRIRQPVIQKSVTESIDGGFPTLITKYKIVGSPVVVDTETSTIVDERRYKARGRRILNLSGWWADGFARWEVTYTAGIAPPDEKGGPGNVPEDIKKAVLLLIKAEQSGGSTALVKSKKIGSWQEQYDTTKGGTVSDEVDRLLEPYRRRTI